MSHDHGSHSSDASSMSDMGDQFCNGDGTVMLKGFQAATSASVNCILFLFEGAGVDTKTKYAFAALGAFCMGFANEMIRYGRDRMAKTSDVSLASDLKITAAFAVQMYLAYMLMLLVMLYEYVILIMLISGLATGHLLTLRWSAGRRRAALRDAGAGAKTPPEVMGSSGTPCCNTDTVA
ncbi:unnamed protein product [Ectocarpus sp. CCAP 1310/34]|nr:unnamed protein product [Ectocarpus sp. CCAP 1310/34]